MYDLIGDIHGHADELKALLEQLGYRRREGVYRHPERRVIFLGDFIDRGPQQREVIDIVRPMVEQGEAMAVMGNHELNAIAWHTPDPENPGEWMRPHRESFRHQHQAFLDAWRDDADGMASVLEWFRSLPLWLDLPGLRVVHACWDEPTMNWLRHWAGRREVSGAFRIPGERFIEVLRHGSEPARAVNLLLKGRDWRLPEGHEVMDHDGQRWRSVRVRWWEPPRKTLRDAFLGREDERARIPALPLPPDAWTGYPPDAPPLFIGHYWYQGTPTPLASNLACLDWSVALPGKDSRLVAYRWHGEPVILPEHLVSVPRMGEVCA